MDIIWEPQPSIDLNQMSWTELKGFTWKGILKKKRIADDLIEIPISSGEIQTLRLYNRGERKCAALHRRKLLLFHTGGNGVPQHLSAKTLECFSDQGYKFVTCFPGISRDLGIISFRSTSNQLSVLLP